MRCWTLAFGLGIWLLQQFKTLPSVYYLCLLCLIPLFTQHTKYFRLIAASAIGFIWAAFYAHHLSNWQLSPALEGKSQSIKGYIASIPINDEQRTTFLFVSQGTRFKLSWQHPSTLLRAGDEWQLVVRLKRIHGVCNPGGFDYEGWAFQEGIRATGYVDIHGQNILLKQTSYHAPLMRLRQSIKEAIETLLPLSPTSPWITALAIGERQQISAENWQVLRNTGTNHLMAIAGLHIGCMAAWMCALISWLWRRIPPLMLFFPAQHAGALGALLIAFIYSALAGFSLPTQRACIMLGTAIGILLLRRKTLAWQVWCIALLSVLVINPLNVLTDSFWLSFGSVALIIYGVSARLAPHGIWWKVGRIQWVMAIGLLPLSIILFQQGSIISFIANSIAIPWVGFVIVPCTLLGCFTLLLSTKFSAICFLCADKALSILWVILSYLAHLPGATWYQVIPHEWIFLTSCLGVILLLQPIGFAGRWFGLIALLPLFFAKYPAPQQGDAWFTLLDIGQGLAAVVQTQKHVLVFDTGPRFGNQYDMGESVVTPFLRSIGAHRIDKIIVSHGDNDHLGGLQALLNYFPVRSLQSSVPEKMPIPASYCLRGQQWEWDGVLFKFIYPTSEMLGLNNDSSCVLQIKTAAQKTILLTGDIEKIAENTLLTWPENLSADLLVAPHHGSKTSAEWNFLTRVKPHYVFFPVGYRNRYHFPHATVIEKYKELGSIFYQTDQTGAIQVHLLADEMHFYRQEVRRYWNF